MLISYIDSTLYCVSEDLYASLSQATPFCIITGNQKKQLVRIHSYHLFNTCMYHDFVYYRSNLLLLHTSTINVLAVSYLGNILGTEISLPCKDISNDSSYKISAHCLCCTVHDTPANLCGCYHGPVFPWKVFWRSGGGWSWVWCCSFPTDPVHWTESRYHVLRSHSTSCGALDGWNDSTHCRLLDHS